MWQHLHLRGGHQQKKQRRQDVQDHVQTEALILSNSALATGLLIRWSEGQLSALDVQDLADLAVKSGADHPEVSWLSRIGSAGNTSGGNCSRAIYRRYLADMQMPEPFFVKVPVHTSKDKETVLQIDLPVLLPHEWFFLLAKIQPQVQQDMGCK